MKNCGPLTALWLKTKPILNNSSASDVVNILPLTRTTNQRLSGAETETVGQKSRVLSAEKNIGLGQNFSTARVTHSTAYAQDDLMKWVELQGVQFNF